MIYLGLCVVVIGAITRKEALVGIGIVVAVLMAMADLGGLL